MEPEPVISLENVAVRLGSRVLLRGTTWSIRPGENWALLGPNGSGKTSLAKALAGLVPVVQGRVTRRADAGGSEDRAESAPESVAVAYVSPEQHRELLKREELVLAARDYSGDVHAITTVGDVIRDHGREPDPGRRGRLPELATGLGIQALLGRDIQSLSSGEMRKTLIARALMKHPRLLILDEPFDGLDRASRRGLTALIERLIAENVQVVLVTHRREELLPGISHLALLQNGTVRLAGRREDVLSAAPEAAAATLGAASAPGGASARVRPPARREGGEGPRVLIRMRAVTVAYKGARVLDQVDWTMRSGENWMIVGPNGAGKSTLLRLIFADHPQAYANEIELFGQRVGCGQTVRDIKTRIGFVSAHLQARYRRSMPALDVIRSGFFDSVGLYRAGTRAQRETAMQWAEALGVGAWVAQDFGRLSYGERQLVLLARAMVKSPRLLVLDEPCDGLDGERRRHLLGLLEWIGRRASTDLLYVTHQAEERLPCITHTLRLDRGRVVGAAPEAYEGVPRIDRVKGDPAVRCRPAGR